MQTILLTTWPFLNLLLYIGLFQAIVRFINQSIQNKVYIFLALLGLMLFALHTFSAAFLEKDDQFLIQQAQPTQPINEPKFHDGLLLTSPTYSIKSHISIWPVTLPNLIHTEVLEPTDKKADAIKLNLIISATHLMPGLSWEQEETKVHISPDHQLTYEINGHLIWCILTMPVYYQPKKYVGTMRI